MPTDALHFELASHIAAKRPRVVAICAPAGYGKEALLHALAARHGALVVCDLSARGRDPAGAILDALASGDRRREAVAAATRLAQRSDQTAAGTREVLRREWPRDDAGPRVLALRDANGLLDGADVIELVAALIATLPHDRMLVLVAPAAPVPALRTVLEQANAIVVGADALALRDDDLRVLAAATGVEPAVTRRFAELADARPLVTLLLLDLVRRVDPVTLERDAAELSADELLAFALHRTIAALDEPAREALTATVVRPDSTRASLASTLGERCDDAVLRRVARLPFVRRNGERFDVHPLAVAVLRIRFVPLIRAVYDSTLSFLTAEGAYAEAARVALASGNAERAVALLEATPPYTTERSVMLGEYERVLDALDRDLVTSYPNVWLATIPYRRFAVDRTTYIREAETVYYCLPRSSAPQQRTAVLLHLASAYLNVGRLETCEQLVDEALEGFARDDAFARASLLNFRAILRGIDGRFAAAHVLAGEASALAPNSFGENLLLHHIDANEAAMRGQYARAVLIVDEIVRRHQRDDLPLYSAYAMMNGSVFAWLNGDEASFERYIAALEDTLPPGIERGFVPVIEAARGRAPRLDDDYPWPVVGAIAQLFRLGHAASHDEALAAARAAVRYADLRRDVFAQVLAHVALWVLDPASRESETPRLRTLVAGVESSELGAAVDGVVTAGDPGMLEAFVARRVRRERIEHKPSIAVELFAGRVTCDGEDVRLRDKELELIVLLATSNGWVSRDRIGETLWNHLEPDEWPNNVKVTLSRVRAKLGVRDAISAGDGGYRLAPAIDVDLRRAEALLRSIGSRSQPGGETRTALEAIVAAYAADGAARLERFGWSGPVIARVADVVCTAGLVLGDLALRGDRHAAALAYARAVIAVDPYNEGAAEQCIRALLAGGDADGARRELRRYSVAVAAELGVEPSPRLVELVAVAERGYSPGGMVTPPIGPPRPNP